MVCETVFRSEDVPAADRFDYWRELMIQTIAPMDLSSDHADDFRASMHLLELGAVHVWPTALQSLRFHRTPKLIQQSDPERLHMSFVTHGTVGIVIQSEQEVTHGPGDLCLVDSSRPFDCLAVNGMSPMKGVGVAVPKEMLPSVGNGFHKLLGQRISGRDGFGALLAQFLTALGRKTGLLSAVRRPAVGDHRARPGFRAVRS